MHPRYRQTPPGFTSGSTSVTLMPRSAARNAAAYPPGPPPMTAMFRFEFSDMKGFRPQTSQKGHDRISFVHPRVLGSSRFRFSSLDGKQERLLKCLGNPAQEASRIGAINQPMVIGQRERQNQPRFELAVDPLRLHPRTR